MKTLLERIKDAEIAQHEFQHHPDEQAAICALILQGTVERDANGYYHFKETTFLSAETVCSPVGES